MADCTFRQILSPYLYNMPLSFFLTQSTASCTLQNKELFSSELAHELPSVCTKLRSLLSSLPSLMNADFKSVESFEVCAKLMYLWKFAPMSSPSVLGAGSQPIVSLQSQA